MEIKQIICQEMSRAAEAIQMAAERLDENVEKAVDILLSCRGKVIVTGMGKTGIIARKIAATLASTGTTAIFLHAAEGIHGDLGILQKDDVVIAISNSGNTRELISIIPYFKFNRIPIIALTGNLESALAKNADVVVDCKVPKDYEPFGLVPTASTTVALAMGDAICVSLLKMRDFKETDFAKIHPGGTIGKKLLLRVADLMQTEIPIAYESDNLKTAIQRMLNINIGGTLVLDEKDRLTGIITDGDLKRIFLNFQGNIMSYSVGEVMKRSPQTTKQKSLAIEALNLMEEKNITLLPVIDDDKKLLGVLHLHDLIKAGIVG